MCKATVALARFVLSDCTASTWRTGLGQRNSGDGTTLAVSKKRWWSPL